VQNVTEINKPTVNALRMSTPLPCVTERPEPSPRGGHLHLLYGDQFKPVGYLVHRPTNDFGIRAGQDVYEDRYFTTETLPDALELLRLPHEKLPGGAKFRPL
jgi:hypothetical protein